MTPFYKILYGDAVTVLEALSNDEKKEGGGGGEVMMIDTVFTAPSPFGFYENNPEKIGGEGNNVIDYIIRLGRIFDALKIGKVLKPNGNLFVQIGDQYNKDGFLMGIPRMFEQFMILNDWYLNDRLIWHRTETQNIKNKLKNERGFLKNYEFIFHFVQNKDFYFNSNSKYLKSSIFSFPLEDSYYTNEFDSGLPEKLSEIIIDTTVPKDGIILDPLAGSAKVGIVAKKMGRSFIGIEIDPELARLCRIRLGLE